MSNPISRNAETRDLRNLEQETENIYLSAIVISKRANQIAEKQKEELRNRLEPFINDSDNLEEIQEDIGDIYHKLNGFIDNKTYMEEAYRWLESHGKLNTNDSITVLVKENNDVKENSRFIQKLKESRGKSSVRLHEKDSSGPKLRKTGSPAPDLGSISPDNRAGDSNTDDIRWNAGKRRKSYIFRTYSEETQKLQKFSEPKESNFNKDKESKKRKGLKDAPTVNQRLRNVASVGPEYDTRQQGTVYPMSGLGDVTYRESISFSNFRKKSLKEAIDDPGANDMGVGGVLGGATNKEPLQTPENPRLNNLLKKKKNVKI